MTQTNKEEMEFLLAYMKFYIVNLGGYFRFQYQKIEMTTCGYRVIYQSSCRNKYLMKLNVQ